MDDRHYLASNDLALQPAPTSSLSRRAVRVLRTRAIKKAMKLTGGRKLTTAEMASIDAEVAKYD